MERETGIGPATNSLEGCDSTTELLPRSSEIITFNGSLRGMPRLQFRSRRGRLRRRSLSQKRGESTGHLQSPDEADMIRRSRNTDDHAHQNQPPIPNHWKR